MSLGVCGMVFSINRVILIMSGDGFDEADFNVANQDHPDQVVLDATTSSGYSQQRSSSVVEKVQMPSTHTPGNRNIYNPKPPVSQTLSEATRSTSATESPLREVVNSLFPSNSVGIKHNSKLIERPTQKQNVQHNAQLDVEERPAPDSLRSQNPHKLNDAPLENTSPFESYSAGEQSAAIGFYTARAAESVQCKSGSPSKAPAFDPHLESPSIRKTVGIDHTKTKPVGKDIIAASPVARPSSTNFVNPQTDKARRVGMPMSPAGSLYNRNSYKPPQIKRPGENYSNQCVTSSTKLLNVLMGSLTCMCSGLRRVWLSAT